MVLRIPLLMRIWAREMSENVTGRSSGLKFANVFLLDFGLIDDDDDAGVSLISDVIVVPVVAGVASSVAPLSKSTDLELKK
jgi:hypothetical protein